MSIATKQELQKIDQDITFVLHKVRKKMEGQRRGIPHSNEKARRRVVIEYWKYTTQAQGKSFNKMVMENREQCAETELNIEEFEMKDNIKIHKEIFREIVQNGK